MLKWVVMFAAALLAILFLGFGGFDGVVFSPGVVIKILFCVFLVMFVGTLLVGFLDGKAPEGE